MTDERRFDRNERLFGREGQAKIAGASIAIVGLGGLGSHFAQQAAFLGCRQIALIDADVVTSSSLNRLVGSVPADATDGLPKVQVAQRLIRSIEPAAKVAAIQARLEDAEATATIADASVIVGCLDDDRARLELTALASSAQRPYVDLATEVGPEARWYGGRVLFAEPGVRCAYCLGELDPDELALANLTPGQRAARDRDYGVRKTDMDARGAAVVSLNGVVASLGVTELMVSLTGMRLPAAVLRYRGDLGTVTRRIDEPSGPCPYCGRN